MRVPKTVRKVTMTRRTRARHDSDNEAGLDFTLRHSTLHTLFFLPRISFCQFSKRCLLWGGYLVVRYLCYEACWPVLERFSIFCLLEYFFCDLSSDKVYQSPQTKLTPSMVIHSISQCTILSLDTPHFLQSFHNAQHRHMSLNFSE